MGHQQRTSATAVRPAGDRAAPDLRLERGTDFALQARRVRLRGGTLTRNDTVLERASDPASLARRGAALAREGYTVWLFVRGPGGPLPSLHLLQTFTPGEPSTTSAAAIRPSV